MCCPVYVLAVSFSGEKGETLREKNITFLVASIFQRLYLYIQVQTASNLANPIVLETSFGHLKLST